jgi:hypothetical protein
VAKTTDLFGRARANFVKKVYMVLTSKHSLIQCKSHSPSSSPPSP